MALLFRSRLRFSSSKITPVLSGSEAHDRIVYSVREGSAVSSHHLVIPSQPQSLPCWGMINIPQGCGCCSLVATCQLSAEGQLCPFNSLGANQEVGAVWALQTPGSVALSHFCRCLAPCHWLLWNPSSRSRRSCWKQSPAKLLKARKTLCRKKWMGWAQWSREHIQTLTQVSSALLLVLEFLSLDTTAAPTSAGSAWKVFRTCSPACYILIEGKANEVFQYCLVIALGIVAGGRKLGFDSVVLLQIFTLVCLAESLHKEVSLLLKLAMF